MAPADLFRLDGKTALVTGSARGLGKEIALGLAQYGASLILADKEHPEKTAEQIKNTGARCIAIQTDISDEAQEKNLTEWTTEDLPVEEWDRIVGINLRGTFLCCKYVGRRMIDNGGGNIVNIASTAGITGVPRAPAYCASKAGVILLTKTLALEWAQHNIRVNAIAPHYLETELTRGLMGSEKVYDALIKKIPLRRMGKTSELMGAVLFLSSDTSSYVTGAVIPVDGGYLAQ